MLDYPYVLARPGHALGLASLSLCRLPLLGSADPYDREILAALRLREGDPA